MKTQNEPVKKTNKLKNIGISSCLLLITISTGIYINSKNSQELCTHVKTIFQKEVKGKISQDSTILFVLAKDSDNAFEQAQNLVIKMKGTLTEKNDTLWKYDLPEENAIIQIVEKEEDECIYIILYLLINCGDYPLKEIHYMRTKCYNNL
ncbi:MAG: hypothetical protein LBQ22_02415 [Bacteroidales bacterium]|jgi:hypothetical protein|nr:hypothetical protein [Bacteroidales bacterium]